MGIFTCSMLPSSISVLKESNRVSWSKFSRSSTYKGAAIIGNKTHTSRNCRRLILMADDNLRKKDNNVWIERTKRRHQRRDSEISDESRDLPIDFQWPFEGRPTEKTRTKWPFGGWREIPPCNWLRLIHQLTPWMNLRVSSSSSSSPSSETWKSSLSVSPN